MVRVIIASFKSVQVEYNDSEFGENPQVPGCDGRLLVVTGRPVMMTDATVDGAFRRFKSILMHSYQQKRFRGALGKCIRLR